MAEITGRDYQPAWPQEVLDKASGIALLALDVDGIMTDGSLLFSASGDELKAFNILDGLGMKQAMAAGIEVAVITGRTSPLTERRMASLGVETLLQGREDKVTALREIAERRQLPPERIATWETTCLTLRPSAMPASALPYPTGTGLYVSMPITAPGRAAVPGRSVN